MSERPSFTPTSAMVLAAGLGKRMRPVTTTLPKPLVRIAGRSLLDRALDRLVSAGVQRAVVNVHYLPDLVEQHLKHFDGLEIVISDERAKLLETGGGTKKALDRLGPDPFLVVNTDAMWLEGPTSNLSRLIRRWNADEMDILLLLATSSNSIGHEGSGDFIMEPDGRLSRRPERLVAPFIYAGVGLVKPELFADTPDGPFSMNLLFDRAISAGRLFGLRLDGEWLHVGTPHAILEAEEYVAASAR
ncbi:MurNAc alpha-1-phosphate uridylyltransferase [Pseudochelatococcus lubricantis]|uniref:MurNAc alpha-1-phosphate uridylyltransferase n=1 Tax=Pseudochelatococcus lubricantis TaxID=1538102 RepID=A0ABX0UWM5_9HYPH|nr:nucleotidyltransferase family protein [Pseudochelatococcus lubricantis]NIJ56250.1 MurNAc alpha-1-phosphate uridylyltransferase [Pseudochelatococcus lubricantis]